MARYLDSSGKRSGVLGHRQVEVQDTLQEQSRKVGRHLYKLKAVADKLSPHSSVSQEQTEPPVAPDIAELSE